MSQTEKIIGIILIICGFWSSGFLLGNLGKSGLLASIFFFICSIILSGIIKFEESLKVKP